MLAPAERNLNREKHRLTNEYHSRRLIMICSDLLPQRSWLIAIAAIALIAGIALPVAAQQMPEDDV